MTLTILSHRLIGPARPFLLGGAQETAMDLQLAVDVTVRYPDGSSDSLPALTAALLPDGVTTAFDWTRDRYIGYTVKGSGVLSVVKESLLASLDGEVCPLCWVREDEVHPFQPTQAFTLTPIVPTISSDICGATEVGFLPTITWTAVPEATDYELQVSTDPAFGSTVIDETVSGTFYAVTSPLSASTTYYVRVRVEDPTEGDWSPSCAFTTGLFDDVPHITYPPDTSTQIYLKPLYTWTAVEDATSYELQVATDSGFTSIVFTQIAIPGTSYQFTSYINLVMNTTYYVRARVYAPSTGSWGPTNAFTTYALSGNCGLLGQNPLDDWVSIYTDVPGNPAFGQAPFTATDFTVVFFVEPLTDIATDTRYSVVPWAMGDSGLIAADVSGDGPGHGALTLGHLIGTAQAQGVPAAAAAVNGTQYCVAMAVRGEPTGFVKFYIDGVLQNAGGGVGGSGSCARMGFGFAGWAGNSGIGPPHFQSFSGKIRLVQYYRSTLTTSDILSIVSTGQNLATASAALANVWPVDEGSGTLVRDICCSQLGSAADGRFQGSDTHWTTW